ncbi:uncharacterized protein LOC111256698 [Setaria italica]|uniref:uncharacterized protein LOC111256698 n=1 Tax=Setaria italica TaxID=4555 RepID=UPI000BE5F14C|nr:uncharacterized protein LOC111256698 [Setaria italica]
MWELLQRLKKLSNLRWLVIGDFNEAMWGYEHLSVSPRSEKQMQHFREALSTCNLSDQSNKCNLLVADGLSTLLSKQFANGDSQQANIIREVLSDYARSTGQLINPDKCSIMFGTGCPQDARAEVRGVLQLQQEAFETKYLGLPTPEGTMKRDQFQPLSARFGK